MPAFHDAHFASYPHRLRTLRDGTLDVLATDRLLVNKALKKLESEYTERTVRANSSSRF